VTRPGIEAGPNVTGRRAVTVAPTEATARARPDETFGCNECNEALNAVRAALTAARRLALIADNALVNGDLVRARSALHDLNDALVGVDGQGARRRGAQR